MALAVAPEVGHLSEDQARVLLELAQDHVIFMAMSGGGHHHADVQTKSLLLAAIVRLREALAEV